MLTERGTTQFLGIEFANFNYDEVALGLEKLSQCERFSYVVTPNVHHIVMLHEDRDATIQERFNKAYNFAALRLCDSRTLRLLARFRGMKLNVVTGSDLTAFLFNSGFFDGKKVAIIGGDKAMLPELRARYPEVEFSQKIPPMGILNDPVAASEVEAFLASSRNDYVLFAIGSPQSEILAHECLQMGRTRGVGLCIGASIEFALGRKSRAPVWMQKAGIEWVFRLLSEPRRLWRRYLVDCPKILKIMAAYS